MFVLLISFNADAVSEKNFQLCVQVKDFTTSVAKQADKGATRAQVKKNINMQGSNDLIDWVYDSRGAYSNQELAKKQMQLCLQLVE